MTPFAHRYLHCSKLLVRRGAVVTQGQPIALVGSTGASTGPHLHFDAAMDPALVAGWRTLGLLETGRALPGCQGRVAVPVEHLVGWVNVRARGKWGKIVAGHGEWILPIDQAAKGLRLGQGWYARRPVYAADGSHKRGPDGRELVGRHEGIDLGAPVGTEIRAARAGVVVLARTGSPSAGNWIVVADG